MNEKQTKGLRKHIDFIIFDIVLLQISYVIAYWINRGYGNPYNNSAYQFQGMILLLSQLIVIVFFNNYRGVIRRNIVEEIFAVIKFAFEIIMTAMFILFILHSTYIASRLQFGITPIIFIILDLIGRELNKKRIFSEAGRTRRSKSIVLMTSSELVDDAMKKLYEDNVYRDFTITAIILMDDPGDLEPISQKYGLPVLILTKDTLETVSHEWVDEVFILQPDYIPFPSDTMSALMEMGMTVNYSMAALNDERWPVNDMRKLGGYRVLTNSIKSATAGQMMLKRLMDIAGGIVGCCFTLIILIIIGPLIYAKSPGPIFFAQNRVGQNGKIFKMYKFRSMYMDAEARKAELMKQNKIADGMMFKMDDDPRIIGSEKKDKNGKPKGIGNFIRNTSLDEFPQFWNVLKGDMSLVGWRPATLDEWQKYNLEHRIRASMKPGITGMWQVSGRSEITDFNEVVRLDKEYIENWNIMLDISIILKTVAVVATGRGAS